MKKRDGMNSECLEIDDTINIPLLRRYEDTSVRDRHFCDLELAEEVLFNEFLAELALLELEAASFLELGFPELERDEEAV